MKEVDKITKKGLFYKTYEGTLQMNGNSSRTWEFTIASEAIYEEMRQHDGAIISLAYQEYLLVPAYQGNTNYIIKSLDNREG